MRVDHSLWTVTLLSLTLGSCGNPPPPRQPGSQTAPSRDEVNDLDAPPVAESPEKSAAAPGPQGSEASPEPSASASPKANPDKKTPVEPGAGQALTDVCARLDQRASKKCPQNIAALYHETCQHHIKKPGNCEKEIIAALECQVRASDEQLCAHQADHNCGQVNRELKVCQRGSAPEEQTTTEAVELPSGWEPVKDERLGFTVALPPGAKLDPEAKRRTWRAEEGGITYLVAEIEAPTAKLSNPVYVRTVVSYVGARCQMRLKLHGELETKGTTVIMYDSACPDGTEWHGMLHFWNGKAVSTGFHAPAGVKGVFEPFFYSFAIAK